VSRGGAPSSRLKKAVGFAICRLREDVPDPYLPLAEIKVCAVCGRDVWVAPSTLKVTASDRWAVVCTYDAGRFKHLFTPEGRVLQPHSAADELDSRAELFAAANGIEPSQVAFALPEELSWMYERGLV